MGGSASSPLAVAVPALAAVTAGLGAFGLAAYDSGKQIATFLQNIHLIHDATGGVIPPLTNNLEKLHKVVEPKVFQRAARAFGQDQAPLKILVVPTLPQPPESRDQAITWLRSKGVDAVIPFRTMLADLVTRTKSNLNYQKSDLLQIIRIFKNYDFFKDPQLDLFKGKRLKGP